VHIRLVALASILAPLLVPACSSTTVVVSGQDGGGAAATYNDLVVFTTKASFDGNLGGIAGADAKCNTYAKAAGLPGTFRAWLSDSSTDARTRVPEAGPWRVLNKEGKQADVAFQDRAAWEGYPRVPIKNTEFGKELHDLSGTTTTEIPYTWTGTNLGGTKHGCHCKDWSTSNNPTSCANGEYGGVIGSRYGGASDEKWTYVGPNPCNAKSGLLCYQVP
jgi:hypothetical protein